ncbi:src tyrosine kinase 2 [Capsaspora owczarzaki ATCC 30864]|uniref:non-specific protein-tyrosine kinase n=1 Tax=Capsaspora owczarzaki (strain ATCC 30864) TaxID=595528 RepID=A0A0D2X0F5_CAPO3|nr:src tyrosine kinase 2 [Capsaspora owczarzaki ATCC 30864]KJE88969.1 TKL protein kinase [Capsaspora owczarzaki ATCC 30864]|eukprot:XP_004365405.1 src tyrosine kinase 2 [Capsaspora owczarzaki ATCC 30864]
MSLRAAGPPPPVPAGSARPSAQLAYDAPIEPETIEPETIEQEEEEDELPGHRYAVRSPSGPAPRPAPKRVSAGYSAANTYRRPQHLIDAATNPANAAADADAASAAAAPGVVLENGVFKGLESDAERWMRAVAPKTLYLNATGLYAHKAASPDELSIVAHESLYFLDSAVVVASSSSRQSWVADEPGTIDPNWRKVRNAAGQAGWVPSTHVRRVDGNAALEKGLLEGCECEWFHDQLSSAATAVQPLRSREAGSFFVYRSPRDHFSCHLVLVDSFGSIHELVIERNSNGQYFLQGPNIALPVADASENNAERYYFDSVIDFVAYHHEQRGALAVPLKHIYSKYESKLSRYHSAFVSQDWEVPSSTITFGKALGAGQFGEVCLGTFTDQIVAVKTHKGHSMRSLSEFFGEAYLMSKLEHPNLLALIGVCTTESPFAIIVEYMPIGSVQDYIRSRGRASLHHTDLLNISVQIADGMTYLSSMGVVHRDLAARNILLGEKNKVKISDFGLAVQLTSEEYVAPDGSKFPTKWTAPEALAYNVFSVKSDVWSYGVCLWEIYSFGRTPYHRTPNTDLLQELQSGLRLETPPECPSELNILMNSCWDIAPNYRPSFDEILTVLQALIVV